MKILIAFAAVFIGTSTLGQDLPGPPANLQSLPAGSYIIAMDNANQTAANGLFNIKTYGLIVHLLNNNVRVRWAIRAGKLKDAVDFNVSSIQIKPFLNILPKARDFKDGPFVIFASDTLGVGSKIDGFCSSNSLTGANYPNIFKTTVSAIVDIRYDLNFFKPNAAVLNDGGNDTIHINYMQAASIPTSNYNISNGSVLASGCYTFASEPHNTNQGPAVDFAIRSIKNFVLAGGNFLAQCAADSNYENNPLGRFQTTNGMNVTNLDIGTILAYPNPDLSFSQFEGPFLGYDGFSFIQNWTILGSPKNNENDHTTGTSSFGSNIVASEAKLKTGIGGLVYYTGVHSFTNPFAVAQFPVEMNNGLRMYMNAFLTPAILVCGSVLPVTLTGFNGVLNNNTVRLQWSLPENEIAHYFDIEESMDGINFIAIARRAGTYRTGLENYVLNNLKTNLNSAYYRVRVVHFNGSVYYSNIISLKDAHTVGDNSISVIGDNAGGSLNFVYQSGSNANTDISVYSSEGQRVYGGNKYCAKGVNAISIPCQTLSHGVYILEVRQDMHKAVSKFIKQ
ncbi:MAG: hypothetical protein NVS9B7_10630 [Flavisolibacter sp.]